VAFRGLYEHSLDSKDRLTVPSRFRASLADGIVLSKGFDPCVWVHTTGEFEQLSDRFLSPHSPFGADARALRRRFTAAPSTRSSTPPAASASPSR
jgi:MraZ protein